MNPVPLFVLAISLPLLLGGCGGEKKESGAVVNPVEEKQQELKEEGKPEEPVAETKPQLDGVNLDKLEEREGIVYLKGSDTPYTGKSYGLNLNGQKFREGNWKDGKFEGLLVRWHLNGQKWAEQNYKDGKRDGLSVSWHKNGQKKQEANYKDGKRNGLEVMWHENGKKATERNYKDGKMVEGSVKYWNSKGEPVDSLEEARK